jgi:hypothetical protein
MTLPDPSLERISDERNERDRSGLAVDGSRPLTSHEREVAESDTPLPERVYAPASERVPVDPVPGHRDFVEHPDASTPERRAAITQTEPAEPSFTRVERPSTTPQQSWTPAPESSTSRWTFGLGTVACMAGAGAGVWLFDRRRRERNKPMNRLRRQAQQAAAQFRGRVPSGDELRQPGGFGLLASLLSIGVVLWRQAQERQAERLRVEALTDADWQHRLLKLRERWTPRRVELEKFSISRH